MFDGIVEGILREIMSLTEDDFPNFCYFYLKDYGYKKVEKGPLKGQDRKHDLWGIGPIGEFIGPVTVIKNKSKFKKKITSDILDVVKIAKAFTKPYVEIIIFSKERTLLPDEQKVFSESISIELLEIEPRYLGNLPTIRFIYSDQMAIELAYDHKRNEKSSFKILARISHKKEVHRLSTCDIIRYIPIIHYIIGGNRCKQSVQQKR